MLRILIAPLSAIVWPKSQELEGGQKAAFTILMAFLSHFTAITGIAIGETPTTASYLEGRSMLRLALYQPDIPQNMGTILRLGACLNVPIDVIGPTGFDLSDKALRRAGMDYIAKSTLRRHISFARFLDTCQNENRRLVLTTSKTDHCYTDFQFEPRDTLLLGRESAGVPEAVAQKADARITIPMAAGTRSLNIAVAGAMILGEALRQTGGFSQ